LVIKTSWYGYVRTGKTKTSTGNKGSHLESRNGKMYVYVVMDLQENDFGFMLKLKCRHTQK
jgi:hypothetical protein